MVIFLVTGLVALTLYVTTTAFYRLYISPLRSIPGPWYAAISPLWLNIQSLRLCKCRSIHALFDIYGPVVRIAPDTIAFLDLPTAKIVYGTSARFNKCSDYQSLKTNNHDHAMTTLPSSEHSRRKRAYAPHYTPSNLALFQPDIHAFLAKLMQRLDQIDGAQCFDCLTMFRHLMADIILTSTFGQDEGATLKWAKGENDPMSTAINDFAKFAVLRSAIPKLLWFIICSIPIRRWQQFVNSDNFLATYIHQRVAEVLGIEIQATAGDPGKPPSSPAKAEFGYGGYKRELYAREDGRESLLVKLLGSHHALRGGAGLDVKDVISEAQGHLIAGVDTTATTLSYIMFELSRRPDIVSALRAELDPIFSRHSLSSSVNSSPEHGAFSLFGTKGETDHELDLGIPDIQILQKLPYLSAVIKETLRIYGAAPSFLGRVVPQHSVLSNSHSRHASYSSNSSSHSRSNSLLSRSNSIKSISDRPTSADFEKYTPSRSDNKTTPFNILGYDIPSNTIVGTQGWSMHRKYSVFGNDSEEFDPSRWVDSSMNESEMNAHMIPFGYGARVCGGQNMAQMTLRIIVAALVRHFDMSAPPETNERSMKICDAFVIFPASMVCAIAFVPRKMDHS